MKILVASNGIVVMSAHNFTFGAWEEADKINGVIVHKWKAEDENENTLFYIIDDNQKSIDGTEQPVFTVHEVNEIPDGAEQGKYLYINGEFVENPDWIAQPKSDAERLAELEENNTILSEELTGTQLALAEQYESNLIVEEELLGAQLALAEQYEANLVLEEELTSTKDELTSAQDEITSLQLAICDLYEQVVN